MNWLMASIVVASFVVSAFLLLPAVRRTGLGVWHPATAWFALEAVFFGIGGTILALDDRVGPGTYVGGCVLAFSAAVALSDRVARRRERTGVGTDRGQGPVAVPTDAAAGPTDPVTRLSDPAPWRPWVAAGLAALGLLIIAPTIIRVGLPALAGDITGARSELVGLALQGSRVAVPALALGLLLTSGRRPRSWRIASYVGIGALLVFDLALASRYLAAELAAVLFVGIGLARWRMPVRALVGLAIVGILLFGGTQILRAYDQAAGRELAFVLEKTANRVALIQPRTLEALQDVIPREQPFFGGLTWARRLGPLVGRDDIPNLGYWIFPRVLPGQDPPGYLAPGVVGEAWANFGPAGLALFALFGLAVERLGAVLARRRLGIGDVIPGALAIVFVARTHALGVNGLAILIALVVGWRLAAAGDVRGLWRDVRTALRWRI